MEALRLPIPIVSPSHSSLLLSVVLDGRGREGSLTSRLTHVSQVSEALIVYDSNAKSATPWTNCTGCHSVPSTTV